MNREYEENNIESFAKTFRILAEKNQMLLLSGTPEKLNVNNSYIENTYDQLVDHQDNQP